MIFDIGKCPPPPKPGPTAIEKALCKVRQEQQCAKKKPKGIHFGSAYASSLLDIESSYIESSFLEFMTNKCGTSKIKKLKM